MNPVVRTWAALLVAALAGTLGACSWDGPDAAAGADATPLEAASGEAVSSNDRDERGGALAVEGPGAAGDHTSIAETDRVCAAARAVVAEDVAVSTYEGFDPTPDFVADARGRLDNALATLAASADPSLSEPALALLDARPTTPIEPSGATVALDQAMRERCGVRLSGLGLLGKTPQTLDRELLAILGLGIGDETCAVGAVLRWADVTWTHAGDAATRDRMAVIVRHSLGRLRIVEDDIAPIDAEPGLERIDLSVAGRSDPAEHAAIAALDAALVRACGDGLLAGGLLLGGEPVNSADVAAITPPTWASPTRLAAHDARRHWCAVADELFRLDVAYTMAEPFRFARRDSIAVDTRLVLGALRLAADDALASSDATAVRSATGLLERADMHESGWLTDPEIAAANELDTAIRGTCGVGLAAGVGFLGFSVSPAPSPSQHPSDEDVVRVRVDVGAGTTTTTSTSLPRSLPAAEVVVVGDSLTESATDEIVRTLGWLGAGPLHVDAQVSRRITSGTATLRSGSEVVNEIAANANPHVWVIALGTNDIASGLSASALRRSVETILAAIPSEAYVVWVDTWIAGKVDAVQRGNAVIREAVARRPRSYVADFFSYGDDPGVTIADGVHLTEAGQQLFADVLTSGVAAVLAGVNVAPQQSPAPTSTSTTTTTSTATTTTTTTTSTTTTSTTTTPPTTTSAPTTSAPTTSAPTVGTTASTSTPP